MTTLVDRKLEHGFAMILDTSGDGRMTKSDFTGLAQRMGATFPGTSQAKISQLETTLKTLWDHHLSQMDTDGDDSVSKAEFTSGWKSAIEINQDTMLADFGSASVAWLDIADTNSSGMLDKGEFVHMYSQVFGLPEEHLGASFDKLDRDGDQQLSRQEIQQAATEFWTSEDPQAPGNWLFGPLD